MSEITKANTIIQKLIRAIIQEFVKIRIIDREIEQIKSDKKYGKVFLFQKIIGGFPLPLSSDPKVAYTDSLLLKLVISSIIMM